MAREIFVNIAVKELEESKNFFSKLGFEFNKKFSDETGTCMVIADGIHVMLLTEEKFMSFTPKPLVDSKNNSEVLICLSCKDKTEVEEMVKKAVAAGGTIYNEPKDYGFMFSHGFQDLDGHIWELVYMNKDEFPER